MNVDKFKTLINDARINKMATRIALKLYADDADNENDEERFIEQVAGGFAADVDESELNCEELSDLIEATASAPNIPKDVRKYLPAYTATVGDILWPKARGSVVSTARAAILASLVNNLSAKDCTFFIDSKYIKRRAKTAPAPAPQPQPQPEDKKKSASTAAEGPYEIHFENPDEISDIDKLRALAHSIIGITNGHKKPPPAK